MSVYLSQYGKLMAEKWPRLMLDFFVPQPDIKGSNREPFLSYPISESTAEDLIKVLQRFLARAKAARR